MTSQEPVLVQTWPGHLFFIRMDMKKEEDRSWAWVRGLLERPRRAGGGQHLEWGPTWPDSAITLSCNLGPGPSFNLPKLLSHLQSVDSNNPHLTGLHKDQIGKKECEKNYVYRKALHKEGSYSLLIPSQSAFQRKLNKPPQTFHSQGYFYFVIFQASKWNWKKNLQRLLFIW